MSSTVLNLILLNPLQETIRSILLLFILYRWETENHKEVNFFFLGKIMS